MRRPARRSARLPGSPRPSPPAPGTLGPTASPKLTRAFPRGRTAVLSLSLKPSRGLSVQPLTAASGVPRLYLGCSSRHPRGERGREMSGQPRRRPTCWKSQVTDSSLLPVLPGFPPLGKPPAPVFKHLRKTTKPSLGTGEMEEIKA